MMRELVGRHPGLLSGWVALLAGCLLAGPGCSSDTADGHLQRDASPDVNDGSVDGAEVRDAGDAGEPPDMADGQNMVDAGDADGGLDATVDVGAPVYELSDKPYTTLQGMWAPKPLSDRARSAILSDLDVTDIDQFSEFGIGVQFESGTPWVDHDELAPDFERADNSQRRSLLYAWESADPQIIDEESPIRFAGVTLYPDGSTYRPQSHVIAQAYESQVRSARRISDRSGRPFDMAFIAGDLSDGGQQNELEWATKMLVGGVINPDSGVDDDPVGGPGNDFTDPFYARGIDVPWYPAVGNHETLYAGSIPPTDSIKQAAVGNKVGDFTDKLPLIGHIAGASNGFRDASTPNGEVVTEGMTPADPKRRLLDLTGVLQLFHDAGGRPAGHGIDDDNIAEARGYYSFKPLAGKPIRFIVLNTLLTTVETGFGGMSRQQFDWLEDELGRAQRAGELVIVGSHHPAKSFAPLSIVTGGELESLLAAHDNVILHLAGHTHRNSKRLIRPDGDHQPGQGYWELTCASTVDFPQQSRIVELVYEGNGYLSAYVTNLEQNAAPGTMGHSALDYAAARKYFLNPGYRSSWENSLGAVNLLLHFKLSAKVTRKIEAADWPKRIESEQTLSNLTGP